MSNNQQRTIAFTLNGRAVTATVAPHETIVEVLQRDFALFGARESCGQGLCGCCTVLVDGTEVSGEAVKIGRGPAGSTVRLKPDTTYVHGPAEAGHYVRKGYSGTCCKSVTSTPPAASTRAGGTMARGGYTAGATGLVASMTIAVIIRGVLDPSG